MQLAEDVAEQNLAAALDCECVFSICEFNSIDKAVYRKAVRLKFDCIFLSAALHSFGVVLVFEVDDRQFAILIGRHLVQYDFDLHIVSWLNLFPVLHDTDIQEYGKSNLSGVQRFRCLLDVLRFRFFRNDQLRSLRNAGVLAEGHCHAVRCIRVDQRPCNSFV